MDRSREGILTNKWQKIKPDRINNSKVHPRKLVLLTRTWKSHKVKNSMDDGHVANVYTLLTKMMMIMIKAMGQMLFLSILFNLLKGGLILPRNIWE